MVKKVTQIKKAPQENKDPLQKLALSLAPWSFACGSMLTKGRIARKVVEKTFLHKETKRIIFNYSMHDQFRNHLNEILFSAQKRGAEGSRRRCGLHRRLDAVLPFLDAA